MKPPIPNYIAHETSPGSKGPFIIITVIIILIVGFIAYKNYKKNGAEKIN